MPPQTRSGNVLLPEVKRKKAKNRGRYARNKAC